MMSNDNDSKLSLLTIPQLAIETTESEGVWRKRVFRREIPFLKLGRNVRVKRTDFDNYLSARKVGLDLSGIPPVRRRA
jgi:excisionase family DNA binding protein